MSRVDPYADARRKFEGDVAEHQLTVIRDDGLYRHLRCAPPSGYIYGFDLVTWPGYLAIVGDAGDYVFSRIRDMFEFFESDSGRINPDYWSEKLQAPRYDAATVYSERRARERIVAWLSDRAEAGDPWDEYGEEGPAGGRQAFELYRAVREQILEHDLFYEPQARELIRNFEHDGTILSDAAWEWNFDEFDFRFLWCCHAIVWGIARYREATKVPA